MHARPVEALIDVDAAVRAFKAFVAAAVERVVRRDALTVVARVLGAVVDLSAVLAFHSQRASASVFRQALQGAGPSVLAGAVVAGVGRHGDLAEAGRVSHRAAALKGGPSGGADEDVTRSTVLALLSARRARVLVLAVFTHKVIGAVAICFSIVMFDAASAVFARIRGTRGNKTFYGL